MTLLTALIARFGAASAASRWDDSFSLTFIA
jgi:hypothetical protein